MAVTLFWLRELALASRTPEAVGGKARHLALLCAAGLPVPDGFVLPAPALRAARGSGGLSILAEGELMAEARAAAVRLGGLLAVRSSSPAEDRPEGAAPGLFSSRLDVEPADLAQAVTEVLQSAEGPAVRAYLDQHRLGTGLLDLSVIVQRQVGGGARGVLYTRPPGQADGDEVWIEAAGSHGLASTALARRLDAAVLSRDPDFPLGADKLAALVRLGLAAEQAIGAGPDAGGADVEWVEERGDLWLVQARPIRHQPAAAARRSANRSTTQDANELSFSLGEPDTLWRWDASHNPDPLSPAQIGLVEWVAAIAPSPMRVVDGYLYVGSRPASGTAPVAFPAPTAAEVQALFEKVEDAILRALAPVEEAQPPDLARALAAYRTVYEAYMVQLTPVLERARVVLRERGVQAPRSLESAVARAARSGDRKALAALAPVWDVAAPTLGERGDAIDRVARAAADIGGEQAGGGRAADDLAASVREISEADDLLFFRAQRAVRRALLGLALAWGLEPPDDVFYLPFDQVRAHAERGTAPDPERARRLARAARDAREAQRERAAPLAFRDGRTIPLATAPGGLNFWRGRSAGPGAARGRVLRVDDLGHLGDNPRDRIIVAQAITPAALIELAGAAALVCEQGGVLDHAAALARELALPCVVGCRGAWHTLASGDEALVDGDAGLVVRLLAAGT